MSQTLVPVGVVIANLFTVFPTYAQFWQPSRRSNRGYDPGYSTHFIHYRGQPLTRSSLDYCNYLGSGVDQESYYRTPFRAKTGFGQSLADGGWEFPMASQSEHSILFIRGGRVYCQDYWLRP